MPAIEDAHFKRDVLIRFSHCDPAGIVFFPQYLVLFNQLVEDWFNECLQVSYADFIGRRKMGLPIVKLECEFSAPSKMGEYVTLGLQVVSIGKSSLTIYTTCCFNDEVRVSARQVLVVTSLESNKSVPIPEDLLAQIKRFSAAKQ